MFTKSTSGAVIVLETFNLYVRRATAARMDGTVGLGIFATKQPNAGGCNVPRARNIKPGFFLNEELADLSFQDRLVFIGLWTLADFKGCLEFKPRRIKASVMPYDDCDIEQAGENLAQARFIRIYSVAGQRYLKIDNFVKHQRPHKNEIEAGSDIPDEDKADAVTVTKVDTCEESPNKSEQSPNKSDSVALNTDSLNIDTTKNGGKPPADNPEAALWESAKSVLLRSGLHHDQAGAFLGKMCKEYSNEKVGEAIGTMLARNPADPKSYLVAVLQDRLGASEKAKVCVGKSEEVEIEVQCKICFDTGQVRQTPANPRWEWDVEYVPCPSDHHKERQAI